MAVIERSVTTALPVAAAFGYVADFENIVEWDPGVVAATKRSGGPVAVGSIYDLDLRYGATSLQMTYTVTELERPHLIVLRADGGRTRAVDTIRFVEVETGTRIDYRAEITMRGLFRLVEPFLGRLFAQVGDGAAAGLHSRLRDMEQAAR